MSNDRPDALGDLTDLERRLSGWRPAGPGPYVRDRLLFEAGRASAIPAWDRTLWRFGVAALVFLNVGLGGLLFQTMLQRDRAERALIAQVQALHEAQVALAALNAHADMSRDARESLPEYQPAELRPSSYLALSRRLRSGGPEDPFESQAPASDVGGVDGDVDAVLSPLRLRKPGASFDL